MKKNIRKIILAGLAVQSITPAMAISCFWNNKKSDELNVLFVSDMQNQNVTSNKEFKRNTSFGNDLIKLIVKGKEREFVNGFGTHAGSNIDNKRNVNTVILNIENKNFDYFSTYFGVDASKQDHGNGIKFRFYGSKDNKEWTELLDDKKVYKGTSEAGFAKLNIKNMNFLKIEIDTNGNDGWDHASFGNAYFYKEKYELNLDEPVSNIKSITKGDETEIKNKLFSSIDDVSSYKKVIFKKIIVDRIGENRLNDLMHFNDIKETVEWLLGDDEALELYANGGDLDGSNSSSQWIKSLKILSKIYSKFKGDFIVNDKDPLSGIPLKTVYKKMAISISLVYVNDVMDWWRQPQTISDPIVRYSLFKKLHNENDKQDQIEYLSELKNNDLSKLSKRQSEDINNRIKVIEDQLSKNIFHRKLNVKVFDNLTIEHMRWIFNTWMNDEEINWLNYYGRRLHGFNGKLSIGGYDYMPYTTPAAHHDYFKKFELNNPDSEKAKEEFARMDKKWNLTKFGIKNNGLYKAWVGIEVGQVCGGISKLGSAMTSALGLPSTVVGQPGHAAYLNYRGNGIWSLDNNVGGWSTANKGERMPLNLTSSRWDITVPKKHGNVNFILLAEDALINYDDYYESENLRYLANTYFKNDELKYLSILNNSLKKYKANYKTLYDMLMVYKDKNDYEKVEFGKKVLSNLKTYPFPYAYMVKYIISIIGDKTLQFELTNLLNKQLKEDANIEGTKNDYIIKHQANSFFSGEVDDTLGKFSFDGPNANKIIFNEKFTGSNQFRISFDGGAEFKITSDRIYTLTSKDLEKINETNNIILGINGTNETFTIDIKKYENVENELIVNEYDGSFVGKNIDKYEWSFDKQTWQDLANYKFNLSVGETKTVFLRKKASAHYLSSEIIEKQLTKANPGDNLVYIPNDKYSGETSSEETRWGRNQYGKYAFDSDPRTFFHTHWGGDDKKHIIWTLNERTKIAEIEYESSGGNGTLLEGDLYYSDDKINWHKISSFTLDRNSSKSRIKTNYTNKIKYLKLVATKTHGSTMNKWLSAKGLELFTYK
ncbi:NPCBM/NEW2 domain-containing protein [Mycoplasma sp. Mirounga ES2805-ORL]|uniref:NPCBM/NEW2 domain-containing protein n=1 Tax=Mycoplasma sp. Mirounga ES2805-ORL TaxID=754514 RepID=UPI00197C17E4|nr:NPCBM/NEW2 domain-containing protein [Mycoplasma sp. Mirounga ES2805-ORL]QSF13420.1 NPCBM/NEW2 domain-containing protein [Mycoplasma sp. Mirounga ES2805-ORL]